MIESDVKPQSPDIRGSASFSANLNNRLGVVYEAMLTYIHTRKALSPNDVMAFIPFNNVASVRFSQLRITNDARAISSCMAITPKGGTCFDKGLDAAYQQLLHDNAVGANQGRTPVFILLTDSEDWSSTTAATLQQIMNQEGRSGLRMHCLGFGTRVNTRYMESLATIGNGAFYNNLRRDDLAR